MAPPSENLYARGFAADAVTERALRAGLAGREVRIQRGRFKAALQTLVSEASPKLVFVDLDGVPDAGAAARELTAVCAIGTTLIAFGSIDTADFTRTLLRSGIADYLVKPISAADVRKASALDDAPERMYAGRVVAFAGTAGSGASTLVAAIARSVATGGRTASVVDLNPVSGTLSTMLGTTPAGDLADLLATLDTGAAGLGQPPDPDEPPDSEPDPTLSPEQIDRVSVTADTAGISVVAYDPFGPVPESPSPPAVQTLLEHLANRAHVVLVAGASDPETRTATMQEADARVLLYEPTLPSISAAVHALAQLGPEHPTILVQSHPRMHKSALSPAQIRYALAERRADVIIPFEPALHAEATGEGRSRAPGKPYLEALGQVIERAVEGPAPVSS